MQIRTYPRRICFMRWLMMLTCGAVASAVSAATPEASFDLDGKHYEIVNGTLFEGAVGDAQNRVQEVYDPNFYAKSYGQEGGKLMRLGDNGEKFPVMMSVDENFDQTRSIADLIGLQHGWTEFTLLAPATPTPPAYSELRQRILHGQAGFIDNRVEPSTLRAHSGTTSLRTYSVSAGAGMQLTKASMTSALMHFKKGDDFWYSAWYFLEKGHPWSIVDLESTYLDQGGGMRLMFTDDLHPYFELKWPSRPMYRPVAGNTTVLPSGVWTRIQVHFFLSEGDDGVAQLWIDGNKVIDAKGQTLPVAKIVFDSLEIGMTSNPPRTETILFVDDVQASHQPLP